jgi:AAA domain
MSGFTGGHTSSEWINAHRGYMPPPFGTGKPWPNGLDDEQPKQNFFSDPFKNEEMKKAWDEVAASHSHIIEHITGTALHTDITLKYCVVTFHAAALQGPFAIPPELLAASFSHFPNGGFAHFDHALLLDDVSKLWQGFTAEAATPKDPARILTGAAFITRHVPPVWLIDGIVQRSRLYACTSLTGHGKTAVWLFNACMIHAGRAIGNLDVFKGNVLFLAGENPADLEARMIGMAKAYNLPHDRLPYVLPGGFPLTEDEAETLKGDIAALGVPLALIVGDTASSFFPGDDENSNTQNGGYARTLRGFTEQCPGKPAVVALCHPVKNATRTNLLPRGGGAFLNELDGNLTLWSENRGEVTELHWQGKIRGPDFSPFGYRLNQVSTGLVDEKKREEMTIIVEPMSEEAVADHAKQAIANEDVVLRALRDHPGRSLALIARDAGWVGEDGNPERWRVQRALRSLAGDKLIQQLRTGAPWKLTDKGKEALQ